MSRKLQTRDVLKGIAAGLGLAVASYAAYAGLTWLRYGERARGAPEDDDALLDRFMPVYEIAERHRVDVAAPAEATAAFNEPGYVKIAWTLRADSVDSGSSVFRTETRAMTTDPVARARVRRYWALVSPGIVLIRRLSLPLVKKEAERRAATVPAAVAG